jgi:L-seryl-tRNA(Ser) seleniumtransferase
MKNTDATPSTSPLQSLPSVDELLRSETGVNLASEIGVRYVTNLARETLEKLRSELRRGDAKSESLSKADLLAKAEQRFEKTFFEERCSSIQRVINATGVVIHTNLGRAPLSEDARRAVADVAGYSNVEYDLTTGMRGKRGLRAERLICELTGAEDALIVNNCAAAAFLVLSVLASGGEVLISRGELVEIGGDFRVPDVLAQSGAHLREVGATNRTRLSDYEKAFTDETRMILKVHPSNYRIIGFSASPDLSDLAALARKQDVIFYEDAGSGALLDMTEFGIKGEPVIADSIKAGVNIVTFSGDKLLGSSQAGIIVGKEELIERLRKHPLYRALRTDKLVYAALEATLESFRKEKATAEIPVLKMLSITKAEMAKRAGGFVEKLAGSGNLHVEIVDGNSVVGGGSAPDFQPETSLIALTHPGMPTERLEYVLRRATPPVIARIVEGRVLLDLRTVSEKEETELLNILIGL